MNDNDARDDEQDAGASQLPEFLGHPLIAGLAGIGLGLIGSAFLLAGTTRLDALVAGYNLGAGTVVITYEVFKP